MELKSPKRKRYNCKIPQSQSLPVLVESISGITACNSLWPVFVGTFSGDSVIVSSRDEMSSLYSMGFFGKGCLSRGYPAFGEIKKGVPPIIRERQWKRRKLWMDQLLSFTDATVDYDFVKSNSETAETLNSGSTSKPKSSRTVQSDFEDIEIIEGECDENFKSDNVEKTVEENKKTVKDCRSEKSASSCNINNGTPSLPSSSSRNSKLSTAVDDAPSSSAVMNITLGSSRNFDQDRNQQLFDPDLNQNNSVIVIDDSEGDDEQQFQLPKPRLCNEPIKTAVETLSLTLEEAFFLSFGLGCLQVVDLQGIFLSLQGMWHLYKESQSDFISSYVTYHYFRSKGWVVKPGAKYGGNFLLYKKGPPFYHASYVVIIEDVCNKFNKSVKREISWTKIMGLNRLTETVGKEILLCQVQWPQDVTAEELNSPLVLPKFKVQEVLLRRWNSENEREEKDV